MLFGLGAVHILFKNFQTFLFLPLRIASNDKRLLLAQGLDVQQNGLMQLYGVILVPSLTPAHVNV